MGMSKRFGPVESEMMERVFEPEYLAEKVPRMDEILDGAARLRSLNSEIQSVGDFQRRNGFLADRSMQQVAKIDTNIMLMLDQLHEAGCSCQKPLWGSRGHKQWFYDWLKMFGESYDVRGKVVL